MKRKGNHNPSAERAKTKVVGLSVAVLLVPLTALDVTTMLSAMAAE
jgi:hypothetical protein